MSAEKEILSPYRPILSWWGLFFFELYSVHEHFFRGTAHTEMVVEAHKLLTPTNRQNGETKETDSQW